MTPNLAFNFSVSKTNNTITVTREFAAQLPLFWDAYTKSDLLDQWWAPKPWKARTKTMDFCEGGHWLYAMLGPEGEEHWSVARYQAIKSQQSFTCLDSFTDADGTLKPDMPQSKWKVTFIDKGQLTLVKLYMSYDDLAQLEATIQMGFKEGLAIAMEGLDELLATKK